MFGIQINKIALTGDSAGGHLCLDIIRQIIEDGNVRIPDGLLLIYPSTRLVFDNMGPTFALTCRDSMIEIPLMGQIQRAVLDLDNNDINHYQKEEALNFYNLNKSIFSKFPQTCFILASNDPMKDESLILADFLMRNGVKLCIKEFLFYCHGFMNFTNIIPFLKKGENECIKFINLIFKQI